MCSENKLHSQIWIGAKCFWHSFAESLLVIWVEWRKVRCRSKASTLRWSRCSWLIDWLMRVIDWLIDAIDWVIDASLVLWDMRHVFRVVFHAEFEFEHEIILSLIDSIDWLIDWLIDEAPCWAARSWASLFACSSFSAFSRMRSCSIWRAASTCRSVWLSERSEASQPRAYAVPPGAAPHGAAPPFRLSLACALAPFDEQPRVAAHSDWVIDQKPINLAPLMLLATLLFLLIPSVPVVLTFLALLVVLAVNIRSALRHAAKAYAWSASRFCLLTLAPGTAQDVRQSAVGFSRLAVARCAARTRQWWVPVAGSFAEAIVGWARWWLIWVGRPPAHPWTRRSLQLIDWLIDWLIDAPFEALGL